jgi:hypothetical protein
MRHGLSATLQSYLKIKFFRLSEKQISFGLSLFLLFTSINFALAARYFLPKNAPYIFAIFSLVSVVFLSLYFGKLFAGKGVSIPTVEPGESEDEYRQISSAIMSDMAYNLTKRQRLMIKNQKRIFQEYLMNVIESQKEQSKLLVRFEGGAKRRGGVMSELKKTLEAHAEPFFAQHLKHSKDFNELERLVIDAEFMLDVTEGLFHQFVRSKQASAELLWGFTTEIGRMMNALEDRIDGDFQFEAAATKFLRTRSSRQRMEVVFAEFLKHMADGDDWNPLVVVSLQERISEAFLSVKPKNLTALNKYKKERKSEMDEIAIRRSIFLRLRDLEQIGSERIPSRLNDPYFTSVSNWSGLENVNSKKFKSFMKTLLEYIPHEETTLIHQFVFMLYLLSAPS